MMCLDSRVDIWWCHASAGSNICLQQSLENDEICQHGKGSLRWGGSNWEWTTNDGKNGPAQRKEWTTRKDIRDCGLVRD